jgi:hypothetical protein
MKEKNGHHGSACNSDSHEIGADLAQISARKKQVKECVQGGTTWVVMK